MTSAWVGHWHTVDHALRTSVRHFLNDNCRQHAAALTFTTLFAVVPLLTVIFTLLAAIPSLKPISEDIRQFIFSNLVPSSGAQLQTYLGEFSQQASQLTVVGIGILFVTALMMLVTIERAFNEIWQVRAPRQGLISFLRYWAVLSLGPFLLDVGSGAACRICGLVAQFVGGCSGLVDSGRNIIRGGFGGVRSCVLSLLGTGSKAKSGGGSSRNQGNLAHGRSSVMSPKADIRDLFAP